MAVQRRVQLSIAGLALLGMLGACSQPLSTREKGTLLGGGLGGASGAIIGAAVGAPGAGAAIGGAMGALTGGLIGDQLQGLENRIAWQQRTINRHARELRRQRKEIASLKRKRQEEEY